MSPEEDLPGSEVAEDGGTRLVPNEVQVWVVGISGRASVDDDGPLLSRLPTEDVRRYQRFAVPTAAAQFLAGRLLLREALACSLGMHPGGYRLVIDGHGRPSLDIFGAVPGELDVDFNLSHTEGVVVCALAGGRAVGIDVERERPDLDVAGLSAVVLCPAERRALVNASPAEQREAFYWCWTAKEAYTKAIGLGHSVRFNSFEAPPAGSDTAAGWAGCVDRERHLPAERQWQLTSLEIGPQLRAALAVERRPGDGNGIPTRMFRLSESDLRRRAGARLG